jgi:hypothetical protein
LLKAVNVSGVPTPFEFGTSGGTFFTTDVTLIGEIVAGRRTRIHGGTGPFRSTEPRSVRTAIRGIHFDAPRLTAVFLHLSSGFEFTDNLVTDVVGIPFGGFIKGHAVFISAELGGRITGTVTIANNVIERVYAELSYGMALFLVDAITRITGNVIRDTRDTAILVQGASQPVWIEDNLIVPGNEPYDPTFFSPGNGIVAGQGSGPLRLRRNSILCGNPWADGIALNGLAFPNRAPGSSVVEHNDVTMHGSMFGGITIYGQLDPSLFANNRVRGDGAFAALVTTFFGPEAGRGHVFRGNNLTGFVSSVADVFFDVHTRENVLVGNPGTVLDLGMDNRITGFSNIGPVIGAEMHAAHVRKRALLAATTGISGQ